jgi:hypothetical protein
MDVWCVCAFFCVCVVLCLGRGLASSWSPVQGVLLSVNDQETKKSAQCSKSGSKLPNGSKEEGKMPMGRLPTFLEIPRRKRRTASLEVSREMWAGQASPFSPIQLNLKTEIDLEDGMSRAYVKSEYFDFYTLKWREEEEEEEEEELNP